MKFMKMRGDLIRLCFATGLAVITIISLTHSSYAQEAGIGKVVAAWGNVQSFSEGSDIPVSLKINSTLNSFDIIKTGRNSGVHMMFGDETILSLGEKSQMKLGEYLYDPGAKKGRFILQINEGTFKVLTGKINRQRNRVFQVQTPTSTVDVKGRRAFFTGNISDTSTFVTLDKSPIVVSKADSIDREEIILRGRGQMITVDADLPITDQDMRRDFEIDDQTTARPKMASLPGSSTTTLAPQRVSGVASSPGIVQTAENSTVATPPIQQVPQSSDSGEDIVEDLDDVPDEPIVNIIPGITVDLLQFTGTVSGSSIEAGETLILNDTFSSLKANLETGNVTGSFSGTHTWSGGGESGSGTNTNTINGTVNNLQINATTSGSFNNDVGPDDSLGEGNLKGSFTGNIASNGDSASGTWKTTEVDGDTSNQSFSWSATKK